MATETITPDSFFSDSPPDRYIGTECEYNLQNIGESGQSIGVSRYIAPKALEAAGLRAVGSYLSNGARLYVDVGEHLEYDTQECLGPRQAAAADLAGIIVMRRIITGSGLPHRGLYRLTGSNLPAPNQKATSERPVPKGKTSGYHENFLMPRHLTDNHLIDRLVPSFLSSRVGTMSGTLRKGFVFSQKVWGIGGTAVTRTVMRRTHHGNKPMAIIPPPEHDSDTIGSANWARLEVRYADASFSPKARFLSLAGMSLVLRMIEHEKMIGTNRLAKLELRRPATAARLFAADLTLRNTAEMRDGRRMSALDIYESLAEIALDLDAKIDLPEDESLGAEMWMDMCDDMRLARPDLGVYGKLVEEIDVAAKHFYVSMRHAQAELRYDNPDAMQRVLIWDRILPTGGAQTWWQNNPSDVLSKEEIEALTISAPARSRAAIRASYVKRPKGVQSINWATVLMDNGKLGRFELYPKKS